ncbi:MAG: tetratricopeptide repeat protein [Deltaproteobacteria bacterium]|nr:tetratricopeptide repeat protein [Deltaproteobacteria bacterium]
MKTGFIIMVIFMAFISSCQTVEKKGISSTAEGRKEYEVEDLKLKEWAEYMDLTVEGDISIDTILRLTEGYLEAKDIQFKKEMEEYEKTLALYNSGKIKAVPGEPAKDYSSLINHFKTLLPRHRYGKGADAIRYILGFSLYEQGKRDEAVKVFEDLVRNYPNSDYIPEVSFRLGEFYFETGQMGDAVNAYGRIQKNPKSVFYDKALYKLGWAYYKLDEFKKAADMFISILDLRWEGDPRIEGLTEEAVSSLVMSLSHIKDTNEGIEYLSSKGNREYTPLIILKLGDQLADETRYAAALSVYKYLVKLVPDNPDIPLIYEKMAEIHEQTGDEDASLETRWVMVHECNPTTPWYKRNLPSGSEKVDSLVSKSMMAVSKRYHYKGKKGADLKHLEKAIEGYRMFLASFPRSPDLMEGELLLAEALFDMKSYGEAAQEYENAARLCNECPERGEIAHSAFLTYEVIFYQSKENREEILRSAEMVLETYRSDLLKSARLEKVRYSISEMYSQTGAFDKARESLMPLVKDKDNIPAYKRVAELYLLEGNLDGAEEVYQKLVERSKDPFFRETLAQLRYRIAEERLKGGKDNDAIVKFNESFVTYPGSRVGEAALSKLGYIYLQRKETDNLEELVKRLSKEYPGSEMGTSLLIEGGQRIEKEYPLKAARLYEYASSITLNKDDAVKLLFAAAILNQENGDYNKAEELLNNYLKNKGIPVRDEGEALYRLGSMKIESGRKREGIETIEHLMELKGKVDNNLIAKGRLIITKEKQDAYLEAKLTQPFEKTLKKKTKLLNDLLEEYSGVGKSGAPELLPEVYFQMGHILENFRDSLLDAEKPKDLTEEELKEYNFLLEEKAYPYEEQAVKAYEQGLEIGREQMIKNNWVEKSLDRLIYLRPALYKRVPEDEGMKQEAPLKEDDKQPEDKLKEIRE